ncbi:acyltransferase [Palleniella muris]|uniref:Acyltransferase n=1 Tax=Palleniella muris TaxID=3038145 RepID=A0AC61QM40_9BACT|nr:acyltransferase [Palleniella muris]TGX80313.1 acyltransferase [Palleniella muris]
MTLLNLLRSIYFNFRYLPLGQAIYLPIWITTNFRYKLSRGQLVLSKPYRRSVFLGDCGSFGLQQFHGGLYLAEGAKLILHGMTVLGEGTVLRCDKNSVIELGNNFYCNKNCFLRSSELIQFGAECSLGWNVQINTNDGHVIVHNGTRSDCIGAVKFGNNVWLTSNVIVTKGVKVADGCIIAQGAVVTKSIEDNNVLVGGVPARVINQNVYWEK